MTVWALVGLLLGSGLAAWCADAVLYRLFFSADIPLSRCLIGLGPPDDFLDRLYIVVSVMLFILFITLLRTRVKHRERYLRCVAKISSELLVSTDLDEVLPRVLRLLRGISGADHCYFYEVRRAADGSECATLRVEDYAPGVGPAPGATRLTDFDLRARGFGRWVDVLSVGKPIAGQVASFPSSERGLLEGRGIRSLLALPLHVEGYWRGFIGFDARRPGVRWSEREIDLLSTAASAMSAALDRAAREEKISAARAEWERTFDAVPDLIAILDTRHRIVRINRAMAERLDITPGEAVGKSCYETVHGLAQPPDYCPHSMLMKDGKEHALELQEPMLGGHFFVTVSPLVDASGALIGIVHVARDITARKSLEEQLLHTQKMEAVGLLAGRVAHDFNNILAGIMGYTHLAKGSLAAGSELINDMEAIERLARRAADMTDSLLAFAKKGEHRSEPIDLVPLVKELLSLLAPIAGKGISIRTTIPPDIPCALGERAQVNQVLMNICLNACEAMGGEGALSVVVARTSPGDEFYTAHPSLKRGEYVSIAVADNGRGIDAETRRRIFDPFFTTKANKTGTGLGLPVSMGIVERHGGCIEVASELGRGSTFTVYLPEAGARAADAAAGAPPSREPSAEPGAR